MVNGAVVKPTLVSTQARRLCSVSSCYCLGALQTIREKVREVREGDRDTRGFSLTNQMVLI